MPPIDDELESNPLFTPLPDDDEEEESGTPPAENEGEGSGTPPAPEGYGTQEEEEVTTPPASTDPIVLMRTSNAMSREIKERFPDFTDDQVDGIMDRIVAAGGSQNLEAYRKAGAHLDLGDTLYGKMVREGKIKPGGAAPPKPRKNEPSNSGGRGVGGPKTQSAAASEFAKQFGGVLGDEDTKKYSKLL